MVVVNCRCCSPQINLKKKNDLLKDSDCYCEMFCDIVNQKTKRSYFCQDDWQLFSSLQSFVSEIGIIVWIIALYQYSVSHIITSRHITKVKKSIVLTLAFLNYHLITPDYRTMQWFILTLCLGIWTTSSVILRLKPQKVQKIVTVISRSSLKRQSKTMFPVMKMLAK